MKCIFRKYVSAFDEKRCSINNIQKILWNYYLKIKGNVKKSFQKTIKSKNNDKSKNSIL